MFSKHSNTTVTTFGACVINMSHNGPMTPSETMCLKHVQQHVITVVVTFQNVSYTAPENHTSAESIGQAKICYNTL